MEDGTEDLLLRHGMVLVVVVVVLVVSTQWEAFMVSALTSSTLLVSHPSLSALLLYLQCKPHKKLNKDSDVLSG